MFRILALLLALTAPVTLPAVVQAQVVDFDKSDPKMNRAMREAQSTLRLWEREFDRKASTASSFMLKVAVPTNPGREIIWVQVERRLKGQKFKGRLANQPVRFDKNQGDPITFSRGSVADWSYWKGGKIHGNYTTRVMLPRLSRAQAAELRALLAPLP